MFTCQYSSNGGRRGKKKRAQAPHGLPDSPRVEKHTWYRVFNKCMHSAAITRKLQMDTAAVHSPTSTPRGSRRFCCQGIVSRSTFHQITWQQHREKQKNAISQRGRTAREKPA